MENAIKGMGALLNMGLLDPIRNMPTEEKAFNVVGVVLLLLFVRWLRNYQASAGADLSEREKERLDKQKAEYEAKKALYKKKYGGKES